MPPSTRYHDAYGHDVVRSVKRLCQDDCLYRNIHQVKHLIIVDIDDIMIPREFNSFDSLVESITEDGRTYSTYLTKSSDYFLDYGPVVNSTDPLITSRFLQNSGIGSIKPIVNPLKCQYMYNHGCKHGVNQGDFPKRLSKEAVITHHYRRSCNASYNGPKSETKPNSHSRDKRCKEKLQMSVLTDYAVKFRDYLLSKVTMIGKLLQLDLHNHY